MPAHEVVILQSRIGVEYPVDLASLPSRQQLTPVETPGPPHQPLAPQHFVDAAEAAGKAVSRIENGAVGVGQVRCHR